MNTSTHSSIRMFGAWCGVAYILSLFVGWWLFAGFLPPPPPTNTPEEVAALFGDRTNMIRIGMVIVMFSALIFIPFAAAVAHYLSRVEGGAGVLTYSALLGGAGNMVLTFYPAVW